MRNFAVARGFQIERPNYINGIINHHARPNPELHRALDCVRDSESNDLQEVVHDVLPPVRNLGQSYQNDFNATTRSHRPSRWDDRQDSSRQSRGFNQDQPPQAGNHQAPRQSDWNRAPQPSTYSIYGEGSNNRQGNDSEFDEWSRRRMQPRNEN